MSLREKVEDNLAVWFLGTLVVGFLAGLATYKSILEIAQLEVVPKVRIEKNQALPKAEDGLRTNPSTIPNSSSDTPGLRQSSTASEFKFSSRLPPFPDSLDLTRPGMKLSEAVAAYPGGKLEGGWYVADLGPGPFSSIAFFHYSSGEDPQIDSIDLLFRDESSRQAVLREALRRFGGASHRSENLGAAIIWPNINGFRLEIATSCIISASESTGIPNRASPSRSSKGS